MNSNDKELQLLQKTFIINTEQGIIQDIHNFFDAIRILSEQGCQQSQDHRPMVIINRELMCRCAICGAYFRADLKNGSAMFQKEYLVPCDANGL